MGKTIKAVLEEVSKSLVQYGTRNHIKIEVDLTATGYKEVATHKLVTITGLVRLKIIPVVTTTGDDTTGSTATISLGHESDTDNFIADTDIDTLLEDEIWLDATPTEFSFDSSSMLDKLVSGKDVGYEIKGEEAVAGVVDFNIWWEPISEGSSVVESDGSAMV